MTVSEVLAIAAVILAAGGAVAKIHFMDREIEKLRAWRHKIGDDPSHAAIAIAQMLEERMRKLEERRR